jgi:hypoxanthine phosphoribosyltransferase
MKPAETYTVPTWNETYQIMLKLAEEILRCGFKPDIIVGVARGGAIPARVLSDLLEQPNIGTVRTECYIGTHRAESEPVLSEQLSASVEGRRVLLVDDVADTGGSLQLAKEHIMKSGAREVKIATLFRKPWSVVKPDYCAAETSLWVVFPWDVKETVRSAFENRGDTPLTALSAKLEAVGLPKPLIGKFLKEIDGGNSTC